MKKILVTNDDGLKKLKALKAFPGHQGRPGMVGGSLPSGASASNSSHADVAKGYLSKLRKKDLGVSANADESKELARAGFSKVEGHNAYIRSGKAGSKNPFEDSFTIVQIYQKKDYANVTYRVYTATHFNKNKGEWLESSEHGYASTREGSVALPSSKTGLKGIYDLIAGIDSYQA